MNDDYIGQQDDDQSIRHQDSLLLSTAQDHKNLIYQFLEIKDLMTIGNVSKLFYSDPYLWNELIDKIVDAHFFQEYSTFVQLSEYKKYLAKAGKEKEMIQKYVDKLISFEFSSDTLSKNANQQFISFDPNYLCFLTQKQKQQIIDSIASNLFRLWQYAEKNHQDIYLSSESINEFSFDYFVFYRSLDNILKFIFQTEPDDIRQFILSKIQYLENKTSNSQIGITQPQNDYYYYFRNTNQIHSLYFVAHIDHYLFFELEPIIRTADFLSKQKGYDILYLYHYLREKFDPLLDLENVSYDNYLDQFLNVLNENYSEKKTNKERLFELMTICNYNIQENLDMNLDWRQKRIEEETYEEEDYDY